MNKEVVQAVLAPGGKLGAEGQGGCLCRRRQRWVSSFLQEAEPAEAEGFGCLRSLEHRPRPPSLLSPTLLLLPWALNSLAILSLARQASPWETQSSMRVHHLHSTPLPGQRQHPRHHVSASPPEAEPWRRHPEFRPLPRPQAPSAGSSAPAPPGSFPRDLHPAGCQPRRREGRQGQHSCG